MILVTGGTGFLGSYFLYKILKHKKPVRALKRTSSSLNKLKEVFDYLLTREGKNGITATELIEDIDWVDAGLLDIDGLKSALDGVSEVYHLAGKVTFKPSDEQEVLATNIQGTANMVNACIEKGIDKFHYSSSVAALDRKPNEKITEAQNNFRRKFSSTYEESKYRAEREVWRGYAEGLKGVVINPAVIIGPGDFPGNTTSIFRKIFDGFSFYPVGANCYVDVRDCADAFFQLSSDEKLYNQRYILSSETVNYKDFFDMIAHEFGVKSPTIRVSPSIAKMIAYADQVKALFTPGKEAIQTSMAETVSKKYYYDASKVREALNFDFIPVGQSVKDTCAFLKKKWS